MTSNIYQGGNDSEKKGNFEASVFLYKMFLVDDPKEYIIFVSTTLLLVSTF